MNKILYTVFFFFVLLQSVAQEIPYINYTTHNGLPQIQVQVLHQDSKGYIWIGTKGGLAKFNGETFQHFLNNQYIYSIAETKQGALYFITQDSIYKQERRKLKGIAKITLPGRCHLTGGNNKFWLNNDTSIIEYRADTLFSKKTTHLDFEGEICHHCVFDKKNNRLLFATTTNKLYSFKDNRIKKLKDIRVLSGFELLNTQPPMCQLNYEGNKYQYIDPISNEVYCSYEIVNDKIHNIKVKKVPVKQFFVKNYWGKEIYIVDSLSHSARKLKMPFKEEIYPFLIDKDYNYWVGTDNGLYQLDSKVFRSFPKTYMNNCWTLLKGKDEKFYGGLFKTGFFRFDLERKSKKEIIVRDAKNRIERDFYYGASKDEKENLYFPTHFGLVKYNYKRAKKFNTGISLISKYNPKTRKVIFGQQNGVGCIDENERIEIYTDSTKQFVDFHPSALAIRENGDIWIGSKAGLSFFSVTSKKFSAASAIAPLAPKGRVVSLAKDYKKNLWIGCSNGLWLYNSNKEKFQQVGKDIFHKQILSIISPDSSLLLLGTSHEIFAIRLQNFYETGEIEYKMFNYRNGFFSQEVSQNGFCLVDDKIYIPSSTTTSILNYKNIQFTPEFFNVYVTSINKKNTSDAEQNQEAPFLVERGMDKLNIEFETVGFGLPTYNEFRYKLKGKDKEWSDWTNRKSVYYSNLKSGKYTFKVMAKSGNYIKPYAVKTRSVDIIIRLPFYREPYFYRYAFYIFALLTFIVAFLIWRYYKIYLAAQEKEKQIKLLEIAAIQSQINPHFIFNFLSSMQGLINQKMPEKANEYLVKFSRLIRAYMESSIKSTKLLTGATSDNENGIKEEIEMLSTYIELESLKYPVGKINYKIEIADDSLLDKAIPPMMIQPFVENSIKHGILPKEGNGTVIVKFYMIDETLVCSIKDDGIGRKLSQQKKVDSIPANKSRGMQLITNRIKMLNELDYNIAIKIEDPEEGGTEVIITIQN